MRIDTGPKERNDEVKETGQEEDLAVAHEKSDEERVEQLARDASQDSLSRRARHAI
jgi:hypothetical protein